MDELLHLARQLRPTALDDHGLVPALTSQVADFGERTGIRSTFRRHGAVPPLSDEEQLVIYRVTQESLSNVAQHSCARHVDVELSFVGRTILRVRDDGDGFNATTNGRAAPRRLRHARARAAGRRPSHDLLRARRRDDHRTDHGSHMRILIADDHGIVRGGLKLLIERQPDMQVVAEAEDGVEAFEQALATKPDLCVMDVVDAAHDRPAGRPPDPRAPARHAGARAVDARRRALRVRRAEGRRVGLRAQARGRPGAAERDPRRPPRRGVPHQRRRALADPRVDLRRDVRARGAAVAARAGGPEADRRGAHEQADRRDPAPRREDRRVAPRRTCCASSACATASSSCATRSGAG